MKPSTPARIAVISMIGLFAFGVIVQFYPMTLPIRFAVVSILIATCVASVIRFFRRA